MSMSQSRFNATFSGLTSVAKKVYGAVPISESWGVNKILAELLRSGVNAEYRTVAGCLNTLCCSGLVYESAHGEFRREEIRPSGKIKDNAEEEDMTAIASAMATAAAKPTLHVKGALAVAAAPVLSPMDMIGALASRAAALAASMKVLSDDISDAAITVQEQIESGGEAQARIKELEALVAAGESDRQKLKAFQAALGALAA